MFDKIKNLSKGESLDSYSLSFLKNPEFGRWRIQEDITDKEQSNEK